VFNDLKTKIKVVDNIKQISPDDFKNAIDNLYKKKMDDWKKSQIDLGGNTNAGEGTRRRIEKDSESDYRNRGTITKRFDAKVSTSEKSFKQSRKW